MINPISSNSVSAFEAAQVHSSPSSAQQPAKNQPQDTVQLSPQATGDVDHDGDAH